MSVPDHLLLAFFRKTSSSLLEMNPEAVLATATENSNGDSSLDLSTCRRCVLDQQRIALREVTEKFQKDNDNASLSVDQVSERLGGLQAEPNLSQELKVAMEDMNEAARVGLCKLVLFAEEKLYAESQSKPSSRTFQENGRLERTKLMEYFVLCQSALKLQCVLDFMTLTTKDDWVFESNKTDQIENDKAPSMVFPQSRLEYVQRLLARGMGLHPSFVTTELKKIFVERSADVDYTYYDNDVTVLFQKLVEQMQMAIRTSMLQIQSKQDTDLLNDLSNGGNTRVVSVQYSEFEVDQYGNKIESKNNAPEQIIDERQQVTEEDKKHQLRMASEAAVLQQAILGELFSMDEGQRNHTLKEAAQASNEFMQQVMALPMGQERIDFLRSVDPETSRKLAMHKLWEGMLQANGGKPPKMATRR